MKKLLEWTVSVGEDNVLPSEWVKYVEVMLDPTLSMNTQMNVIYKQGKMFFGFLVLYLSPQKSNISIYVTDMTAIYM